MSLRVLLCSGQRVVNQFKQGLIQGHTLALKSAKGVFIQTNFNIADRNEVLW